jgi:hypothetical protein
MFTPTIVFLMIANTTAGREENHAAGRVPERNYMLDASAASSQAGAGQP